MGSVMTIGEWIEDVRRCMDEDVQNASCLRDAVTDLGSMDNMIRSRSRDALLFAALHAPLELLAGDSGMVFDYTATSPGIRVTESQERGCTVVELPGDFVRLSRVRGYGWHRAVLEPLVESSDAALALMDVTGAATEDRPQAVLVNRSAQCLELYPKVSAFELSLVLAPEALSEQILRGGLDDEVEIPYKIRSIVSYYTAYLVLSGYRDGGAKAMLEAVKNVMGGK